MLTSHSVEVDDVTVAPADERLIDVTASEGRESPLATELSNKNEDDEVEVFQNCSFHEISKSPKFLIHDISIYVSPALLPVNLHPHIP